MNDHQSLLRDVCELHRLGASFYTEEVLVNEPNWSVDFDRSVIRCAYDGGLIAVVESIESETPIIVLYNSNLLYLNQISCSGKIHGFYVTKEELIVVLYTTGDIGLYDQKGNLLLNREFERSSLFLIVLSAFYDSGFFFVSYSGRVYHIKSFANLELEEYASCDELASYISCGTAVPAVKGSHGPLLWAYCDGRENSLLCLQKYSVQKIPLQERVVSMSFSADFSLAMLVTEEDSILICNADMSEGLVRLNFPGAELKQVSWCGSSVALLRVDEELLMAGKSAKVVKWDFTGGCYISSEPDGARILANGKIILIRELTEVPKSFISKEDKPGANFFKLVDDKEAITIGDKLTSMPEGNMTESLRDCLEAAQFFRKRELVRELLRTVSQFVTKAPRVISDYEKVIRDERLIENLEIAPIGMPITTCQLQDLGYDTLLVRLCNRGHHLLAFRMSGYLKSDEFKTQDVLNHWAHSLIYSHMSIEDVFKKLDDPAMESVDFLELARFSFSLAKRENNEMKAERFRGLGEQFVKRNKLRTLAVDFRVRHGEYEEAVLEALRSADCCLITQVIDSAIKEGEQDTILRMASKDCSLMRLYFNFCPDMETRVDLLKQNGYTSEALSLEFKSGKALEEIRIEAERLKSESTDVFKWWSDIEKACKLVEIEFDRNIRPYDIYDKSLAMQKDREVAKILGMEPSEIFVRNAEWAIKLGDRKKLIDSAMNKPAVTICDYCYKLLDRGLIEEADLLSQFAESPKLLSDIQLRKSDSVV